MGVLCHGHLLHGLLAHARRTHRVSAAEGRQCLVGSARERPRPQARRHTDEDEGEDEGEDDLEEPEGMHGHERSPRLPRQRARLWCRKRAPRPRSFGTLHSILSWMLK